MKSPQQSQCVADRAGGGSEVLVICSRHVQRPAHKRNNDGSYSCKTGLPQDPVRDIDL